MLLLALLFCLLSTAFYFRIRSCLHFQCTTYWRRWLRSINFSFVNKCNKAIVFVCLFALAACFIHVLFRPRVHSRATNDHSYSMVFVHIKCTFFFSLHINAFIKIIMFILDILISVPILLYVWTLAQAQAFDRISIGKKTPITMNYARNEMKMKRVEK